MISYVQFSSVSQLCLTLCNPMNRSTPGLPVHHQLPEFTQTHVHWVGDAIQPPYPALPFPPALNLSQHQGLFKWVSSSHQVTKVLEFQLQHQSFQWTPRTYLLSVQFSHSVVSNCSWPHGPQHSRPPCPSPTPRVYSNSFAMSQWCHPTISSSVIPFFSCFKSFPASGSFQIGQLFASGGQSTGVSASTSVLPKSTQDWSPLGWPGLDLLAVQGTLKSLLQHHSSKALILRCSAFFIVQLSHPYMTTGKTIALTRWTFVSKVRSLLFNMLSGLVITFLPRSKNLLVSCMQSPSAVVLEPKKIKSDTVSTVSPSISHEVIGPDAMIFVFWMLSFKPVLSLSSFTFIMRFFHSSLISAIRHSL